MFEIKRIFQVEYYATGEAVELTTEKFVEDYDGAIRRGAALGRTYRRVNVVSKNFADTDTHLAAFGTSVTHEPHQTRGDLRGQFHCDCGAWCKDVKALVAHQELAGVEVRCRHCGDRIWKQRGRWYGPNKDDWCSDNEHPHAYEEAQ